MVNNKNKVRLDAKNLKTKKKQPKKILKKTIKLGSQYLLDFYGCPEELINNNEYINDVMNEAAKKANATIIKSEFHYFEPYGVSGVVIIQESHFAIHTWPEYGYAALDVFTCGEININEAIKYLKLKFKPTKIKKEFIQRGNLAFIKKSLSIPKKGNSKNVKK